MQRSSSLLFAPVCKIVASHLRPCAGSAPSLAIVPVWVSACAHDGTDLLTGRHLRISMSCRVRVCRHQDLCDSRVHAQGQKDLPS